MGGETLHDDDVPVYRFKYKKNHGSIFCMGCMGHLFFVLQSPLHPRVKKDDALHQERAGRSWRCYLWDHH